MIFAGNPSLYASPPEAYHVDQGGEITFDTPVRVVQFFFVHAPGGIPLRATAYDVNGNVIASTTSNLATTLNDPANYENLAGASRIAKIVIDGGNAGTMDNLTFVV